jgi:hypothetical protein
VKKKNIDNDKWMLPEYIYDNYPKVSTEYLRMVFDQAEKFLNETVRSGEGTTEKAHKILAISLTILTGSFVYLVGGDDLTSSIALAAMLSIPICLVSISHLIIPLRGYETYVIGSSTAKLLIQKCIEGFPTAEDQTKNLLLSECVNYQERIEYNEKLNRRRSKLVDLSLYIPSIESRSLPPLMINSFEGI